MNKWDKMQNFTNFEEQRSSFTEENAPVNEMRSFRAILIWKLIESNKNAATSGKNKWVNGFDGWFCVSFSRRLSLRNAILILPNIIHHESVSFNSGRRVTDSENNRIYVGIWKKRMNTDS